ncbi:hypothetical protein BJ875DRAFT_276251 [Amylocarpus encephaloides]|uniref:Uncharacterized protein n=1 Tax=Amylocarpus encephaloides TaxID=45428 RepID=A0A9P8C9M2_9HELO|nr:hypothetical protein BJ875DRAFT_276251 [Amylocarpus encephaloides]
MYSSLLQQSSLASIQSRTYMITMDSPTSSTPSYRIFRDKHGIPQFEPKRGTRALKDALIYSFPALETELQLMQAALKKFFESEKRNSGNFICELPENNLQASLAVRKEDTTSPLPGADAFLKSWKVALAPQRSSRTTSRTPSMTSRATSRPTSRASSRCATPSLYQEPAFEVVGGTMSTWQLSSGETVEKKKRQPYDPVKRRKVAENRGNACERHRSQKSTCDPASCPQNKLYVKMPEGHQKPRAVAVISEMVRGSLPRSESPFSGQDLEMLAPEPKSETNLTQVNTMSLADNRDLFSSAEARLTAQSNDFWSGDQASVLCDQNNDSLLNLHNPLTMTSSGSWTGTRGSSDSPYSNSEFQTSIAGDITLLPPVHENGSPQTKVHQSTPPSMPTAECFPPQSWEDSANSLVWPSLDEADQPLECGDDPFMGWSNKRARQDIEDYSWVLSHVEQL